MTSDKQHAGDAPTARSAGPTPALIWRKSTVSNATGNCVELAVTADGSVAIRNSRFPDGVQLTYTSAEIAAFVRGVQAGEFDDLLS